MDDAPIRGFDYTQSKKQAISLSLLEHQNISNDHGGSYVY
jgi:hypothetical protein